MKNLLVLFFCFSLSAKAEIVFKPKLESEGVAKLWDYDYFEPPVKVIEITGNTARALWDNMTDIPITEHETAPGHELKLGAHVTCMRLKKKPTEYLCNELLKLSSKGEIYHYAPKN